MKQRKDRQQLIRILIGLAEILILAAAVAFAIRFLPGGGRKPAGPDTGTAGEAGPLPEITGPEENGQETEEETESAEPETLAREEGRQAAGRKPEQEETEPPEPPYEPPFFIVASDVHYQSPAMTDYGAAFQNFLRNDDGKVVQYLDQITDAFLAEAVEKQPDALILSGDLTQNGEKANHEALAEKLRGVEEQGVPVLVIPGNHDINHPEASYFEGEERKAAEGITADGFYSIYREFGYDEAMDRDEASLSYMYRVDDRYWLMMLDSCQYDPENKIGGRIRKETLAWMEEWLKRAKEEHVLVIPIAHHNLLKESTLYPEDCTLENAVPVIDLLEGFGLPVYISGHLHLQRIKKHGNGGPSQTEEPYGIYEIVSDSMAIPPCQYGELRWKEDGSFDYGTCQIDVAGWAKEQGLTDENLLNFPQYSADFLVETIQNQLYASIGGIPKDRKFHMAKLYGQLNSAYCAGTAVNRRDVKKNLMYFYWERYLGTDPWYDNMQAILKDVGHDNNALSLTAGEDFPYKYEEQEEPPEKNAGGGAEGGTSEPTAGASGAESVPPEKNVDGIAESGTSEPSEPPAGASDTEGPAGEIN